MFFQDRRTAANPSRDHYSFQSRITYAFMADDQETDEFVHVDASDAVNPAETEPVPQHVDLGDAVYDTAPDEPDESIPHHGQQGDSIDISDEDGYQHPTFLDRMNQEKEQNKTNLTEKLRRRSTVEELGCTSLKIHLYPSKFTLFAAQRTVQCTVQ